MGILSSFNLIYFGFFQNRWKTTVMKLTGGEGAHDKVRQCTESTSSDCGHIW